MLTAHDLLLNAHHLPDADLDTPHMDLNTPDADLDTDLNKPRADLLLLTIASGYLLPAHRISTSYISAYPSLACFPLVAGTTAQSTDWEGL